MSLPPREERKLQHQKIDQLAYLTYVFEYLAHKLSPGNLEFEPFQYMLRMQHAIQVRESEALPVRQEASGSGGVLSEDAGGEEPARESTEEEEQVVPLAEVRHGWW